MEHNETKLTNKTLSNHKTQKLMNKTPRGESIDHNETKLTPKKSFKNRRLTNSAGRLPSVKAWTTMKPG